MLHIGSHQVPSRTLLLIGVDAAANVFALLLATMVRLPAKFVSSLGDSMFWFKVGLVVIVCGLSLYFNDLYDFAVVRRRANLLIHMMQAVGTTCLALSLVYYVAPDAAMGRGIALIAAPLILALLSGWRLSANGTNLLATGGERVLVVGTGDAGISLVRHIIEHPEYNLNVIGFLDENGENIGKSLVNPRIIGATTDLEEIASREDVGRVILSMKERRGSSPLRELLNLKLAGVNVEDVHSCFERLSGRIKLDHLSPSWLILSDGFRKSKFSLATKRIMDFGISALLLVVVSPLLPIAALAIYLDTGRPIFFRQTRIGYKGREFDLIKFRSMVQNAEDHGPQWASRKDNRVTRVGRILRKTRFDEIPQLFNVFRGEMSLVGPRPERPIFCQVLAEQIPFFSLRHTVRPGLTGWAQVRFRYGASLDDAKGKLELDLFYLKNLSLIVDCAILFETIKVVLLARGSR